VLYLAAASLFDNLHGSKRRRQLKRLDGQWRKRIDHGETAQTALTPLIDLTNISGPAAPSGPPDSPG
jgi:hypothetical protein